jgi:hypothetical protein
LLGITDTAMLRPQVFAFLDGDVQVGLIASEKQAIDATLLSLSRHDPRICPVADRYWNARGGSHTDGGSFFFNLQKNDNGDMRMACMDKFGQPVPISQRVGACDFSQDVKPVDQHPEIAKPIHEYLQNNGPLAAFKHLRGHAASWTFDELRVACRILSDCAEDPKQVADVINVFTLLNDRTYSTGSKKASHVTHIVRTELYRALRHLPYPGAQASSDTAYRRVDMEHRDTLRPPQQNETTLVIDAGGFPAEGPASDAALLVDAYRLGWRHFITFNCRGQRYVGCGLGPDTDNVTIDVYGSSGDYLGSGIDGLCITVHGNAQDQLGQIVKAGKLVIHGDVGQTFLYGAKGGSIYVRGNAAGRPMINSVGKPRVVINGTCLDFLAESFMAGDPLQGGGFAILNGITPDENGHIQPLSEPYPGSNLFSLASGGAIYVRDPQRYCVEQQLNGGDAALFAGK